MIRSPRFWLLFVLLVGPIAVYVTFGVLWLTQRGWALYGFIAWATASVIFGALSVRWTRGRGEDLVLPPIDWDAPRTFVPFDLQAWKLVEVEADAADTLEMTRLTEIDTYLDTGKRLARRLAAHYHPLSTEPIDNVPIVQLLTALELAADDLNRLCREVPGGDMITAGFWKKAVQAAGFFSKANEIYGYVLPFLSPVTGIARLGTSKLVTGPAWKNMQHNLLRWFYRAFVNRLGTHLIELYSGRLAIGADQYRRLTRKRGSVEHPAELRPLRIAVVGARDSGRTTLIEALSKGRAEGIAKVRGRLEADGFDESLADLLAAAEFDEVSGYTIRPGEEAARDRATRREAVERAAEDDLVLLTMDARREDFGPETRFVTDFAAVFARDSRREAPPLIGVLTHMGDWKASVSGNDVDTLVRTKIAAREDLPKEVIDIVAVELSGDDIWAASERLLIGLAPILERAERIMVIRTMQETSARSKAGRLFGQVARQGKRLFSSIRSARKGAHHAP